LSASVGGKNKDILHRRRTPTHADGSGLLRILLQLPFSPATCGAETCDRCAMNFGLSASRFKKLCQVHF
jgi:hypothetical protein